jgi:hypothetical protein
VIAHLRETWPFYLAFVLVVVLALWPSPSPIDDAQRELDRKKRRP